MSSDDEGPQRSRRYGDTQATQEFPEDDEDGVLNDDDDDDDDDEVPPSGRRRGQPARRQATPDEDDDGDIEGDDLFGDNPNEDEDTEQARTRRKLDDVDLDSGDDLDRHDREMADGSPPPEDTQETTKLIMDADMGRHAIPQPSDGELYLMKVPRFLGIESVAWKSESFQPPTTDHHSNEAPSTSFSAYNTALTAIRWRHSPSNPSELQSNARILRWSDGSLTLQLASDPTVQYEIDGNHLAPPQRNPLKPTPVSMRDAKKLRSTAPQADRGPTYDASQDSFTFLVAPFDKSALLRTTNKITAGLQIRPAAAGAAADDAIERLQASLAAAIRTKSNINGDGGLSLQKTVEDPELAKKKAEVAERDRLRAQKRRDAQEFRDRERGNRVLNRSGVRSGGLNAELLEGDDRARAPARPRQRRAARRDEYSDEDEYMGRRRTKEDEYDMEDDFMAGSDEEIEMESEDDDLDEKVTARRDATPKRDRGDDDDEDEDEGGLAGSPLRSKKRRIIDEDDDE